MSILLDNSLASSTISVYKRAWALYNECIAILAGQNQSIGLPLNYVQILTFISYLNLMGFSPSSITTYITGISFVHKMGNYNDPSNHFAVQKTLSAVNRLTGKLDSRLPITLFILATLNESIEKTITNKFQRVLLKAMFTTAFFGLFRIGEITSASGAGHVPALDISQCQMFEDKMEITIKHFKHNVSQHPIILTLHRQTDALICPVTAMQDYLSIRGLSPGPLFCFMSIKPVSRNFFAQKLKFCLNFCGFNVKRYKCHSFRIGGASYFYSLGYSEAQLKTLGRWNSNAFLAYIRNQRFQLPSN